MNPKDFYKLLDCIQQIESHLQDICNDEKCLLEFEETLRILRVHLKEKVENERDK